MELFGNFSSFPLQSQTVVTDGITTYDRAVGFDTLQAWMNCLISNGVFVDPSNSLQVVTNSGMSVTVKSGKCCTRGVIGIMPKDVNVIVPAADSAKDRVDRVFLRYDVVARMHKLVVEKNAPPPLRNLDCFDLALCDISVKKGVTQIVQSSIDDLRYNTTLCGIVTGAVDQINTTDLFAQYNSAFSTWFELIKGQLTTDQAGNLQRQINNLSNPNLLIDSHFQIWDEGDIFVHMPLSGRYCPTMWYVKPSVDGAIKVQKTASGLHILATKTCTASIQYRMEELDKERINGTKVTLSYSVDRVVTKRSYQFDASAKNTIDLAITVMAGASKIINWVKLEEGTLATPCTVDLYQDVLRATKRYYLVPTGYAIPAYRSIGGSDSWYCITFDEMRIAPKVQGFVGVTRRSNSETLRTSIGIDGGVKVPILSSTEACLNIWLDLDTYITTPYDDSPPLSLDARNY